MSVFINNKEIGRRIREFRHKARFSQEKLAEAIDMSFQQIQKYENGRSKLNTSNLQLIAEALGITVYAFFDGYIDAPYNLSFVIFHEHSPTWFSNPFTQARRAELVS